MASDRQPEEWELKKNYTGFYKNEKLRVEKVHETSLKQQAKKEGDK